MSQRDDNPYPYSDTNKRYMTYDWYMKARFGGKTAKLPLDISCTCPNLDGTKGSGGCIYCKNGGASPSFGAGAPLPLAVQLEQGRAAACRKWSPTGFIPYFQAHSCTYGDPDRLRSLYLEAISFPGCRMIDIATRPDCLGDGILSVLEEMADSVPVMLELGLQTSRDDTARLINRCLTNGEFLDGYGLLRMMAERVNARHPAISVRGLPMKRFLIGIHLINGLPGEGRNDMVESARFAAALHPDLIKLHVLHVLRGTPLEERYAAGEIRPLSLEEHVSLAADQLEILPPDTIVGRISGDGTAADLLAPLWCRRKRETENALDRTLFHRNSYQGRLYRPPSAGK